MENSISALKNLSILVIEDEENIRKTLVRTILMLCNKVYDVATGEEGYSVLKEKRVDIILSDINLPKMSGIDLIEKIRSEGMLTPAIMLTAYTKQEYISKAFELKLTDYLIKPIDLTKLQNALLKATQEIKEESVFGCNVIYKHSEKILLKEGESIKLTHHEISLIDLLIKNHSRVTPQEEIESVVWEGEFVSDSAFKSLLSKVRKKIGKESLINRSGIGYKLI